tara:strand:+ start:580 stop:1149 length:570 start_codon:yes stop_codon:yes gene_type:complete
MATNCDLTRGRGLDGCLTTTGGIKAVYLCPYGGAELADTNSSLTTFNGVTTVYEYQLKRGAGGLSEVVNASTENGTVFYTPTVTIKLHKLTTEDQNELKLIAQNTLLIFVVLNEINNAGKNVVFAVGTDNGCTISGGTNSAGQAMADFNGYEWTFEANQSYPMWTVADYSTSPLDNATFNGGAGLTIVS